MLWNTPLLLASGGVDLSDFIEAVVALLAILGAALGGIMSKRKGAAPEVFEGEEVEDEEADAGRKAPVRPAARPLTERQSPPRGAPVRPVTPPWQAPRPVASDPFDRPMQRPKPQRPRPAATPAQRPERRVIVQPTDSPHAPAPASRQLLVVDDDHETRQVLGAQLPSELAAHPRPALIRGPASEPVTKRVQLPIDPKRPARTAIILSEILGLPRSMRGWDG